MGELWKRGYVGQQKLWELCYSQNPIVKWLSQNFSVNVSKSVCLI
jgi:hypothetical protein